MYPQKYILIVIYLQISTGDNNNINQLDTVDPDINFFSENIVNFNTYSIDSLQSSTIDKKIFKYI